jgi:hypothetical protein
MRAVRSVVIATIVMVWATGAVAGTLNTGELFAGPGEFLTCHADNVGAKAMKSVTVEQFDWTGALRASQTCTPLSAGANCVATGLFADSYGRCRVTIAGGAKKNVRAVLLKCTGTTCLGALPAN